MKKLSFHYKYIMKINKKKVQKWFKKGSKIKKSLKMFKLKELG